MTILPAYMSGVVLTGHGGPDCLEWRRDLPVPQPGPGDVVVRIAAAAVNNTDINTRVGWYSRTGSEEDAGWGGTPIPFPHVQGIDGCGRIVGVGAGVDPARIGERVLLETCLYHVNGAMRDDPWFLGSDCWGTFAQYTRIASVHAHRVTSDLTDAELATFPCSYSTAENMLTRAQVTATDHVLVTGASGGVGSAAIQLAKARGAQVTAVSTPERAADLRAIGADHVVDRNVPLATQITPGSVNVAVDLVGGPDWSVLVDCLSRGGRIAVAGAVAGPVVRLDLRPLYLKDISLFGCTALDPGVFANLVKVIEAGRIKPLLAATFPLSQIAEAQAAFAAKSFTGKIALNVE
ncbi:NADPH:quinone reductase-like Zn-dependent oxidoreductase [Rubricella aquisinus]|uniref:NADPH:quinone reductase-like Zn-dependent oxidoreductase n=1 Tax=Rubricella aquisinus TaxID=2028108 RepID=A0A840X1Z2_9RHOB|nr:zinc-binding dehydrogenase [Rubricella aquisinus]MBB5514687.1 NADPH:quinone reductase-like Zn-dependent oxidoreductase [Rubricella aquisinus]